MSIIARIRAIEREIIPVSGASVWLRVGGDGPAIEKRSATGFILTVPTRPKWLVPGAFIVDQPDRPYPRGLDLVAFRARLLTVLTPAQRRLVAGCKVLMLAGGEGFYPDGEDDLVDVDLSDPFVAEYAAAMQFELEEDRLLDEREAAEVEARRVKALRKRRAQSNGRTITHEH